MLNDSQQRAEQQAELFLAVCDDVGFIPVFSHCSAVEYWGVQTPADCLLDKTKPHIVFPDSGSRRRSRQTITHVWKAELQPRPHYTGRFHVVSPQTAWAQIAQHCSEESLAVTAGSFMCRDRRRKVTTLDYIERYVHDNPQFPGRRKCLNILPYLAENTDSPPESVVVVLVMRANIGKPVTNHRIDFENGEFNFIDIAYPEIKFGIEYQGYYHADPAQMKADARRLNRLRLRGWEIVLVTADDLRDETSRKRIIAVIRALMERQRQLMRMGTILA
ncbi:hypothetical protein [Bifidobacterium leontopitheci]|nr:hypothetical protein [Bifidobacterium leontopitheci]